VSNREIGLALRFAPGFDDAKNEIFCMKKSFALANIFLFTSIVSIAQQKATVREYVKNFKTYPFSDPDPVPEPGRIYPYYRFDGYTNSPIPKNWKVVELENNYIKVMILPEIGGKIWAAIEKTTGKPFIYYNHVVKFRDVAMRGPWTSGGIEPNYGIIGHTPNCATPVDYITIQKADGSVSCVIGVLDLLTRTTWRIDINLPADKAYFTTSSFWYNASPIEQPYYTWMNTGIKAAGNLQFIYPGTRYLGHEGEYSDWPANKQNGKDISFYNNNDFGGYKSYHVFGKYTDFFGGYWHDEDFGMGRYSTHDDKPGKKIWIWGLSQQGMIWEKLLTDTDGQYVEVQSGRLFNQSADNSTFTPFKHKGFLPHSTDQWTEYWFPVIKTKGFVAANNFGALNIKHEGGALKIYFSPLQKINDELKITSAGKVIYSKTLRLNPLQTFADSIKINSTDRDLVATLGTDKVKYEEDSSANVLSRPVQTPDDFSWNSTYGLYLQGKEKIRERDYAGAKEKLEACLKTNPYYTPALTDLAMVLYHSTNYDQALRLAKTALSVDTYDPAANYYYGLINLALADTNDAKDGFDIASLDLQYRNAAYTNLAKIYLRENNLEKAADYARKCVDCNKYAVDAYQVLAIIYRLQKSRQRAETVLDTLQLHDPLNHFAYFERYLWQQTETSKARFTSLIRNEMPQETYLELAIWYNSLGRKEEAAKILQLAPRNAEVMYWQAYLENKSLSPDQLRPDLVFPFRPETADVLKTLIQKNDHWLLKYHLALIQWSNDNISSAKQLFEACGNMPGFAPFYAARARFNLKNDSSQVLGDLQQAAKLDKQQWRYGKSLVNYYLSQKQYPQALTVAADYRNRFPANYIIGMLYAKTLMSNKQYNEANKLLQAIQILPNEGATDGRQLYRETQLMLALDEMIKKNYNKALQFIAAARLWPENLGVGKPYAEDIDERVEDWLAYENYTRLGNDQAAEQMLDHILAFKPDQDENGYVYSSVKDLVNAWALQKKGKSDEAEKLLKRWAEKQPGNNLAKWALNAYKGNYTQLPDEIRTDENYRVLQEWIAISRKL
jgi:tetratricopeptide (TPR) repeat protein